MRRSCAFFVSWACLSVFLCAQKQDEMPEPPIKWQHGPVTGKLGTIAEIKVPEGFYLRTALARKSSLS